MRLENRVAIVTGGGSGIGRATALRLAREGAKVVIGDINLAAATATVDQIHAEKGAAVAVLADVADPVAAQKLVDTALNDYGGLHILVNNAGLPSGYDQGTDMERWNLGIEQSLSSVQRMSLIAIPSLLAGGGGAIVNISSINGTHSGNPQAWWYSAAKHGVIGLTRSLAGAYGKQGLRANAVAPGLTVTPRTERFWGNPGAMSAWEQRTPLGRLGQPDDIAAAVAFLASDDASYITGHALVVDGGYTIS